MINQNSLLAKIAVFDSGLGSLSIIKEIQKIMKADIVYFADQKNYPYGTKSQAQMASIIKKTICMLEEKFTPDVIVVASNTPSLMLNLQKGKIIDVKPPLKLAKQKTKSKKIGILATKSSVKSKGLVSYVKENNFPDSYKIFKINGSELVDLVETGKFLNNENYCKKIIKKSSLKKATKIKITPYPMAFPIPSRRDLNTPFPRAKASSLPITIQFVTIKPIKIESSLLTS